MGKKSKKKNRGKTNEIKRNSTGTVTPALTEDREVETSQSVSEVAQMKSEVEQDTGVCRSEDLSKSNSDTNDKNDTDDMQDTVADELSDTLDDIDDTDDTDDTDEVEEVEQGYAKPKWWLTYLLYIIITAVCALTYLGINEVLDTTFEPTYEERAYYDDIAKNGVDTTIVFQESKVLDNGQIENKVLMNGEDYTLVLDEVIAQKKGDVVPCVLYNDDCKVNCTTSEYANKVKNDIQAEDSIRTMVAIGCIAVEVLLLGVVFVWHIIKYNRYRKTNM